MKATTITLTLSALIACAAVSIRAQTSASDEPKEGASGITTKTNQYGATTTNEFGASTNWNSTNLPPTSTNNLPRIYGTNSPSGKSGSSVPDEGSPK